MRPLFQLLGGTAALAIVAFVIAFFAGWVMNIVAIIQTGFSDFTVLLLARLVGIFLAPLGSLLGWFA